MGDRVLITGGAGFIGSHVADELLAHGFLVRALDNLTPQVHDHPGTAVPVGRTPAHRPAYLHRDVELIVGDVRDPETVARALRDVDVVIHLAAAVGVGQSMYQIVHYTSTNTAGTAVLLEALAARPVQRLIVASSMSIYGEGLYVNVAGKQIEHVCRDLAALRCGRWEPVDEEGVPLIPLPTPERKPPSLESVYALSKFDQERLCLLVGRAYGMETLALRFFNVYGPRQALSNPYTGVLAIFAARLLAGKPPLINEDGLQRRDFVSVHDVATACRLALQQRIARPDVHTTAGIFNIGSGESMTILEVAHRLNAALGGTVEPQISQSYRVGDIRHCFADISLARASLRYEPRVRFEQGVAELAEWLAQQNGALSTLAAHPSSTGGNSRGATDLLEAAQAELTRRGLAIAAESRVSPGQAEGALPEEESATLSTGGAWR